VALLEVLLPVQIGAAVAPLLNVLFVSMRTFNGRDTSRCVRVTPRHALTSICSGVQMSRSILFTAGY